MDALREMVMRHGGRPLLVAYSGGMDSSVLLHQLAATNPGRVRALHVHHGLHHDAEVWAAHCQCTCDALGIPLLIERVHVEAHGLGREGDARSARHAAFARHLHDDEVLVLAHHRDDQAETFVLRALRGSGVDGLAAMRPWRAYANGWSWRPLLDTPRAFLHDYAISHGLSWIEDPSNGDPSFDRNFLRTQLMPLLHARWPHAGDAFARSAALSADASDLLEMEDDLALTAVGHDDGTLSLAALEGLPASRRARVLRRWVANHHLPPLPSSGIACVEHAVLAASRQGEARFEWAGACIQQWRGRLHAQVIPIPLPPDWSHAWDGSQTLQLPTGATLELHGATKFDATMRVHARQGGERLMLPGRSHHHALKHVLQDRGIPPWRRTGMPLLSDATGTLQAVGDGILSGSLETWLQARGARLHWRTTAIA